MKLIEALELGRDCGLDDVRSALENINIHVYNLFPYREINSEITELVIDLNRLFDLGGDQAMSLDDAIELMKS